MSDERPSVVALCAALVCERAACPCHRAAPGGKGLVHCPAHPDRRPSLSVRDTNGRVLFRCQAGCTQDAVLASLRERGLWRDAARERPPGLSLAELANAKRLPEDFLISLGVREGVNGVHHRPCVDIPYLDADGEERAVQKRIALHDEPRFLWRRGDKPIPYGLSRLKDVPPRAALILCEGASDCWTLWHEGFAALGLPGAATWRDEYATLLAGRAVFIWQEPDAGGAVRYCVTPLFERVFGLESLSALPRLDDLGGDAEEIRARLEAVAERRPA